jgi:inositol-phosphate transport system substrate-binding protein
MKASRSLLSIILIVILVMSFTAMALAQDLEIIPIKIRCRAKPPMENWRGLNFLVAEKDLNADLEAIGDSRRVKVEIIQDNLGFGELVTEFVLGYGVGEAPDIWLTGHEFIGAQAEAGRIIPLDGIIEEFPIYNLVFDTLWDCTEYKGEIWGVPQDAEARPLYWNKTLLKKLGWSDEEVAALSGKIEKGEFTLYDMLEIAKQAVDKGVVEPGNGFWTRPSNGPDFTAFYYAFGGETIDPATGKLVFDKTAGLKYYKFFDDAVQKYGSMGCLGLGWSDAWHPGVSGGKVLFWIGGTWQWAEWAEVFLKDLGGEAYMWENFGFGLIPAAEKGGKPNSLTHPLTYLVSSQCKYPDLAVALIAKVTNYGPNTRHAVASTHLGILKGQTEYKFYKGSRLLSEALYMLDYTTFLPNSPDWGPYSTVTYEALAAVISGDFTPEEAVDFVVEGLNRELGDKVIIK